ncbi:hypothetical protein [Escherichia marmotae]|uniref:hypothetical protein n=1 Tax=Escherichia marmotae TaxID=1499973 RepID=UPI002F2E568A
MTNVFIEKINNAISDLKDNDGLPLVFKTFEEYCNDLVLTRTGLSMKGIDGAPDWYGYERIIWESGFKYIEPILKNIEVKMYYWMECCLYVYKKNMVRDVSL